MDGLIQLRKADVSFNYNGPRYDLTKYVDGVTIEDPETKHLTRGGSGKNKKGLSYGEGTKDPKKITIDFVGFPVAYLKLIRQIWEKEDRIDVSCIDRKTGDSRVFKEALVVNNIRQLTMKDGVEEANFQLLLETFDIDEDLADD